MLCQDSETLEAPASPAVTAVAGAWAGAIGARRAVGGAGSGGWDMSGAAQADRAGMPA